MGNLHWISGEANGMYLMFAEGENGMKALIWADEENFVFPGVFVEHAGLRKIPDTVILDPESAMKWCEEEIAMWRVVPKK